ncbi:hypothetical protein LUZ60_013674 [Juncus effusus]|nr:hypothetical protein LUZ60_013674 [Juncus effusus]
MERGSRDTYALAWKLELMKKRLSSLRDADASPPLLRTPAFFKRDLERLELMWNEYDSALDDRKKNRIEADIIFRRFEDLIDEVEYEAVDHAHSISQSAVDPKFEVANDPTSNTMKRFCMEPDSSFSGMLTTTSFPVGLVQNEYKLVNEQPESINDRIKHKHACEKEVGELIGTMDDVIAREKRLDDPNDSPERVNVMSTFLGKRKKPREKQAVNLNSFSDYTSLEANKRAQTVDDLTASISAIELRESDRMRQLAKSKTANFQLASILFERGKDVTNVLKMLLSKTSGSTAAISVLPVVGMGGLGKTTLAQLVYNNKRVRKHFDLMAWSRVSLKFDLVKLMRELIKHLTGAICDSSDLDDIRSILERKFMGRTFFMVLDDAWDVSKRDWEFFMSSLRSAGSGCILVTTRVGEVARVVQTMPPYRLGCLTPDDSWSMFKCYTFDIMDRNPSDDILEIGKKIVAKCKGLPLAIKAIGSVLHWEHDIKAWEDILSSDVWSSLSSNEILPALRLSYTHLPSYLKLCFPAFSLFPKDFVFSKDDVVRIWMSLNFLEHENGERPEDLGSFYFNELLQRSFIEQNHYGKRLGGFVMHDLIHDLAEFVAGEEFSRIEAIRTRKELDVISSVSYLSIVVNNLPNTINIQSLQEYKRLRVLKVMNLANKWNNNINIDISDELFRILKFLRVLDFSHTGIEVLPYSIGKLRLLRYLNLAKTNIKKLPESISGLYNLRILELRDCSLQELPQGINNLVNLRHLNLLNKSTCMPCGIGALINLQTLPVFNIRRGIWHCEISELKGLVNLRGELTITGLRNVTNVRGVKEANLRNKDHLRALTLDWATGDHVKCNHSNFEVTSSSNELCSEEEVLDWLQPNALLEELHIHDYSGSRFPKWLGDASFHTLSKITINGCGENCEFLPTLGLLPSLKSLSIQWMYSIPRIGREFCSNNETTKGFQSLETLEFKHLPNWVEWFGVEDGEFIKLHKLRIVSCHELQSLPQPLSSSLTKLLISNCEELSVLPFLPSLTRLALNGKLGDSLLQNLHLKTLRFVKIASSENITCIPLNGEKLPSLEVLVIKGCKNLEYIVGISSMVSLKRLEIVRCQWVQIFHEEIPHLLKHLTIVRCPSLQEWYQVITVKYKNQLSSNRGDANNEIKTSEEMCARGEEDDCEDEVTVEVMGDENDVECELENIESDKREKGKNLQLGERSDIKREENERYPVPMQVDDTECAMGIFDEFFVEDDDDKMIVENAMEGNDVQRGREWFEAERKRKGKSLR